MGDESSRISRRAFLHEGVRIAGVLTIGGGMGALIARAQPETVWQIDPRKCIACELCATACVITPSAVRCVHSYAMCGYCDLCFGYFLDQRSGDGTGAENQRCPTNALRRTFVEEPYYQYVVEEEKCIGCAICVKGCDDFGNGSLYLQIRHHLCVQCNQCAIAAVCPVEAISRIPAKAPYLPKIAATNQEDE